MAANLYDPHLHLLLDPETLHQVSNAVLVPGRLNRRPEPVLTADQPWEGHIIKIASGTGSVLYDEQEHKFRMWYLGANQAVPRETLNSYGGGYAESTDGIHWHKPRVGLFEFAGSKDNNIVVGHGLIPGGWPGPHCPIVIEHEPGDGAEARFTGLVYSQDSRMYEVFYPEYTDEQRAEFGKAMGHYFLHSDDGIHWRYEGQTPRLNADRFGFGRDHIRNEWLVIGGGAADPVGAFCTFTTGGAYCPRRICIRRSKDLKTFGPMEHPFFLGEYEGYGMTRDHHTFHPYTYGNMLLGHLDVSVIPSHGPEEEIVTSMDGRRWNRPLMGYDFLPDGALGTWDAENASFAASDPIRVGDELYFYYSGSRPARIYTDMEVSRRHHEMPKDKLNTCDIGLATLRLDAFAGWRTFGRSREHLAFVTTAPVEVTGPYLQVNFDSLGGHVRAEVRGENFEPIEGLSAEDGEPALESGVRMPLRFKDGKNLGGLVGKKVTIRFLFNNGTIFSYRFNDQPG